MKIQLNKYYLCDIVKSYNADGMNNEINSPEILKNQWIKGEDIKEWDIPQTDDMGYINTTYRYISGPFGNLIEG